MQLVWPVDFPTVIEVVTPPDPKPVLSDMTATIFEPEAIGNVVLYLPLLLLKLPSGIWKVLGVPKDYMKQH